MTGDRCAHPLLISLANIKMEYRCKGSHHAFLLLALLPIPKFINTDTKIQGTLENRLIHECLDFILHPLKMAARFGIMLNDPRGVSRYCFTPLAAYIADTPEAAMLAGVKGKTSHLTMASFKQFGDPFRHEPRTASTTLAQLDALASKVDPTREISEYVIKAKKIRLNGVHHPFWRDWPLAEPSQCFPLEVLHHVHKAFWDHDRTWCIKVLGGREIDFRFSVLQPHVGVRHFKEGISKLRQVTGRDHRNIQRFIVSVCAGSGPNDFVIAIRALMDFRYLIQSPIIDDRLCDKIQDALKEFHDHKHAILEVGAREDWHIPKLEFLQSAVAHIKANGAVSQWTADVTEHAHIEVVKDPGRSGNNQRYEDQICRALDREDKCRRFDLATAIRDARVEFGDDESSDSDTDGDDESTRRVSTASSLLDRIRTVSSIGKPYRPTANYFEEAARLSLEGGDSTPFPYRTFSIRSTAFHLNRDPAFPKMTVNDVAIKFNVPDLAPALFHFYRRLEQDQKALYTIGGRRPAITNSSLPFHQLEVWSSVRMQLKDYHCPDVVLPSVKLNALPPSADWPFGRCDPAIANTDPGTEWPKSGIAGEIISFFIPL